MDHWTGIGIFVFLIIRRLPLISLRSKLVFHVILLSFHINSKRFIQNQKGNKTKYFAKISLDFGVEPLRSRKKCGDIHKQHSCDGWTFKGLVEVCESLEIRLQSSDPLIIFTELSQGNQLSNFNDANATSEKEEFGRSQINLNTSIFGLNKSQSLENIEDLAGQ